MPRAMNVFKPPSPEAKFKCEAEQETGTFSQEPRSLLPDARPKHQHQNVVRHYQMQNQGATLTHGSVAKHELPEFKT